MFIGIMIEIVGDELSNFRVWMALKIFIKISGDFMNKFFNSREVKIIEKISIPNKPGRSFNIIPNQNTLKSFNAFNMGFICTPPNRAGISKNRSQDHFIKQEFVMIIQGGSATNKGIQCHLGFTKVVFNMLEVVIPVKFMVEVDTKIFSTVLPNKVLIEHGNFGWGGFIMRVLKKNRSAFIDINFDFPGDEPIFKKVYVSLEVCLDFIRAGRFGENGSVVSEKTDISF